MAQLKASAGTGTPADVERGKRIAALLEAKGWTQTELAQRMGVSKNSVNNFVNGKKAIRPENVAKLCKLFNCTEIWLNYGKGRPNDPFVQGASVAVRTRRPLHPGLASWLRGTREGRSVAASEREWLRDCPWPEEIERAPDESYQFALEAYRTMMRAATNS